jgi:ATP-binding cassette subfamily B protein
LSAVDTRTEARILESLRARRGRHTTILVTHRLSTAALADRVLVLDAGRLAQSGTHAELAQREGAYRRLWLIQGALEREIDAELALDGTEVGA